LRDCEDHDPLNPQAQLGNKLLSGDDPIKNSFPSPDNAQRVDLSSNMPNDSGWLGGGSTCFSDKTFTVMGQSFTLPFSQVCDILLALRYAFMLICSIVAYRMVSGVILRD
jgi:hypothetical protein